MATATWTLVAASGTMPKIWRNCSNKYYSGLEGRMHDCSVRLPAGTYTVRVARTWQPGIPRVHYSATEITARLE